MDVRARKHKHPHTSSHASARAQLERPSLPWIPCWRLRGFSQERPRARRIGARASALSDRRSKGKRRVLAGKGRGAVGAPSARAARGGPAATGPVAGCGWTRRPPPTAAAAAADDGSLARVSLPLAPGTGRATSGGTVDVGEAAPTSRPAPADGLGTLKPSASLPGLSIPDLVKPSSPVLARRATSRSSTTKQVRPNTTCTETTVCSATKLAGDPRPQAPSGEQDGHTSMRGAIEVHAQIAKGGATSASMTLSETQTTIEAKAKSPHGAAPVVHCVPRRLALMPPMSAATQDKQRLWRAFRPCSTCLDGA